MSEMMMVPKDLLEKLKAECYHNALELIPEVDACLPVAMHQGELAPEERSMFEAWSLSIFPSTDMYDDSYEDDRQDWAFRGWQARAALDKVVSGAEPAPASVVTEQIAADERNTAVCEMMNVLSCKCGTKGDSMFLYCQALYDAGLRMIRPEPSAQRCRTPGALPAH